MRQIVVLRLQDDGIELPELPLPVSASERARFTSFSSAQRRREFLLGRALLLAALQRAHGHGDWIIERSAHGRPYARRAAAGTNASSHGVNALSVSHAAGVVVAACATDDATGRIGCDVEVAGNRTTQSAARIAVARPHHVFAEAERAWIVAGGDVRWLRFLVLWTAKEAFAKAAGLSVFTLASRCADVAALPGTLAAGMSVDVAFAGRLGTSGCAVQVATSTAMAVAVADTATGERPALVFEDLTVGALTTSPDV